MSIAGIGASSSAWDYWELLRRSEARQNASLSPSALDVIKPIESEAEKTAYVPPEEASAAAPPARQNLFAEQLAATILEQERSEEGEAAGASVSNASTSVFGGAAASESSGSGNSSSKIAIKSITDGGTRYIVGVRTDENGDEVEVFRIPQGASAQKLPMKESQEFLEMELLKNTTKKTSEETSDIGTTVKKLSAALIKQAQNAYGMYSSLQGIYNTAA